MPVLIVLFIPKDFLTDVWSEDNPDAYFPRPRGYVALDVNPRELSKPNTRYLQNVAYCRLKKCNSRLLFATYLAKGFAYGTCQGLF